MLSRPVFSCQAEALGSHFLGVFGCVSHPTARGCNLQLEESLARSFVQVIWALNKMPIGICNWIQVLLLAPNPLPAPKLTIYVPPALPSRSKGRSSAYLLLRLCRQSAAIQIIMGIRLLMRYIPSEYNCADGPSRGDEIGVASETFAAHKDRHVAREAATLSAGF